MKVYGNLEKAALESLASNPATTIIGNIWWNTTATKTYIDDGTNKYAFLRNDGFAVFGNNGTAANNIRFHRGASGVLQLVSGADVTAEGTLSTALNQLSFRAENYTTGALPAAGNIGRIVFDTTTGFLKIDNGSTFAHIDSGKLLTTKGDLLSYSTVPARQAVGTNGQILTADSAQTNGLIWSTPTTANNPYLLENISILCSVGGSALTIALKQSDGATDPASGAGAVKLAFRDTTASSAVYTIISSTAATSVVVPSGATLGGSAGSNFYIYVYAINNAGAVELAVSSSWQNEGVVGTTGAIGVGSDDNGFYSTAARTSKAIRLIARLKYSTAPNGTYSATPDLIEIVSTIGPQVLLPQTSIQNSTTSDMTIGTPTVATWYIGSTGFLIQVQPGKYRAKVSGLYRAEVSALTAGFFFQFGTSTTPGSGLIDRKIFIRAGFTTTGAERWSNFFYYSEPFTITATSSIYLNTRYENFSGVAVVTAMGFDGSSGSEIAIELIQVE